MLGDIDLDSLHALTFALRAADKEEIFNLVDHDCPYQLGWEAFMLFRNKGRAKIGFHKGRPAAVIALTESRPSVWEISMFGTDELKHVAFECMRWARINIAELAGPPHNGRRLQCDSRVGHDEAHKFLLALGARREGEPMLAYGKDGSAYQRFVWVFGTDGVITDGQYIGVERRDMPALAGA